MKELWDFIKRHAVWVGLLLLSAYLMAFQMQLINTLIAIIAIESLAIGLSGLANYAYTKLDFHEVYQNQLGQIFLAVHILVGMVTLGIYFAL